MSGFYKMDPAAWDIGTSNLTLEQEAAYLRIINAIHKHTQTIPNNDRVLAGMFRCSTRKARALVEQLIAAGKIRIEDGMITNDRAASDLVHRGFVGISRAEAGAKGGRTRAENARKSLEDNNTDQANASTREEKRREEKKEGGGVLREDEEIDPNASPDSQLWDAVVRQLGLDRSGRLPTRWQPPHGPIEVASWPRRFGLTEAQCLEAIRADSRSRAAAGKYEEPRGPKAFENVLAACADGLKQAAQPARTPTKGNNHAQGSSARDRRSAAADDAFVRIINAAAGSGRTS
ncbi:MAG: DUF1376 domain-containing protein [Paracoccus sp.]|nr:DUF1376 domain-containing protein [Paracoccus sp. (in: a-proteobacteria)]